MFDARFKSVQTDAAQFKSTKEDEPFNPPTHPLTTHCGSYMLLKQMIMPCRNAALQAPEIDARSLEVVRRRRSEFKPVARSQLEGQVPGQFG